RDGPRHPRGHPGGPDPDDRDPGARHLLDRLPSTHRPRRARLVPGARRRRAVHRQASSLHRLPDVLRGAEGIPVSVTEHALQVVQVAARAASDKLGQKIVAYDVSETLAITEAFVLAS